MNRHISSRCHAHNGWALLEVAVVLALLGLMMVAVWETVQTVQQNKDTAADQERHLLVQAEAALYGDALVNFHFPAPQDGAPSPGRPGYLEGWLPPDLLSASTPRRIRYLVHASLVDRPSAIYKPDPLQLAEGRIRIRTEVNGLDLCLTLIQQERASTTALPGGMRLGFALQESSPPGAGPGQIWVGDSVSGTPPAHIKLDTRTRGFSEVAQRLGCFNKLAQISVGVKSTAVLADLVKLAEINVRNKEMSVKGAEEAVINLAWRKYNWIAGIASFTMGLHLTLIQMDTSLAGRVSGLAAFTGYLVAIGGVIHLLEITDRALARTKLAVPGAKTALAVARKYKLDLEALMDDSAARTNQLQNAGLNS